MGKKNEYTITVSSKDNIRGEVRWKVTVSGWLVGWRTGLDWIGLDCTPYCMYCNGLDGLKCCVLCMDGG